MSFYKIYDKYKDFNFDKFFSGATSEDVERSFFAENLDVDQFLFLLSGQAENYMERMAQEAHEITLKHFGRAVQLYTPIYLSNYCDNRCVYCGFSAENDSEKKKLDLKEVEKEAEFIASTGLKHILVLTGSSRKESPLSYIKRCISVLKKYFSSISVEIYALTEKEYEELIAEGVDGLTIYQEVYDRDIYDEVHLAGEKKDYMFRLDAPERAAQNRMRTINIGVLLGLNKWQKEAFFMGLHAKYLQDKFPDVEVSVSIPRIRPQLGGFKPTYNVTDKDIVQIILAVRIFLPRIGITLSTREDQTLRENLIPLGVTKISAGSTTIVGGHTVKTEEAGAQAQFEISDKRDVAEIKKMLSAKGYQPVLKDWVGS